MKFANTQIKKLNVGDFQTDLDLTDSQIEELPSRLTIQGNLIIGNAPIKELPSDLIVTGDIDLSQSTIKKIPREAYIGGNIIGNNIVYNPVDLYNGRITSKVVMWKNKIIPYRNTSEVAQREHHDGSIMDVAIVYYGLSKDINAIVVYRNKWFYLVKKGDNFSSIYKDIEKKKQVERIGDKYKYIKMTDLFTFEEIFPIYQQLTNSCEDSYKEFKDLVIELGYSTTEKYSLSMWIMGSKKSKFQYNYLFTEYFEKEAE
jgi:hypothetical protein